MPRSPAIGHIACDVSEVALFSTDGTSMRQSRCRECETTFATFPVGQSAVGTNVSNEFTGSRIAAMRTSEICFLFVPHLITSIRNPVMNSSDNANLAATEQPYRPTVPILQSACQRTTGISKSPIHARGQEDTQVSGIRPTDTTSRSIGKNAATPNHPPCKPKCWVETGLGHPVTGNSDGSEGQEGVQMEFRMENRGR